MLFRNSKFLLFTVSLKAKSGRLYNDNLYMNKMKIHHFICSQNALISVSEE